MEKNLRDGKWFGYCNISIGRIYNLKKTGKGSMKLVDQESSDSILKEISPIKKDSGGSVANTIVGISMLGKKSFFCGKVKKDILGDEFVSDMRNTNTKFLCEQSLDGSPTARCIVFVTPDGERSMQTFLGASTTLSDKDIEPSFFNNIDYLLIEGYLWSSDSARKAILKAVEISKKKDIKIVFSLSDSNLVQMFREDFIKLISSDVDILIGNESEFDELLGKTEEVKFLEETNPELLIKTKGENGVLVIQNQSTESIPSDKVLTQQVNVAGFLFKLLSGKTVNLEIGCKTAACDSTIGRLEKELMMNLDN